jgi:putative phosphoesterase
VGLISDTHGLLRPEAIAFLRGSSRIVHAGDIGAVSVLDGLRALAPLEVVRGNNDTESWASSIPPCLSLEIAGARILVLHDRADLRAGVRRGAQIIIAGHSHKPAVELENGVLFINPGSAGPRRFKLPIAAGELCIERGVLRARIVDLSTARAIPGLAASLELGGVATPVTDRGADVPQ